MKLVLGVLRKGAKDDIRAHQESSNTWPGENSVMRSVVISTDSYCGEQVKGDEM
jgi:hypothetical protein